VYCGAKAADSRDHIISAFLGGKRRVPSCAAHNHAFGHTFEAEAAKQMLAWTVQLASWGVPLLPMKAWYERALMIDGRAIDLRLGTGGLEFRLHKPVVLRDTGGTLDKIYFRSKGESRAFMNEMQRRDPDADWRPFEERVTADLRKLRPSFEVTPGMHQLALKMSIAAASRLPNIQPADLSQAAKLLNDALPMPSTKTAAVPDLHLPDAMIYR
jgi:hypothetical protein